MSKAEKPVSVSEIAAFATPAAPLLALALPTIIFLPPHFAAHLGLPLWAVSLAFFAARMLDIIVDPFIGGVQDRTTIAFGRRRFWMLASCPPLMLLIWLAFIGLGPGASLITALVTAAALYGAFAMMNIAHLSWAGELIPTYHGRTRVLGAVQAWSMLGQIGVLALAAYVVQGLGGSDADAVHAMGWAIIIGLPITALIAILFAREHPKPPQAHVGLGETVRVLRENSNLRRVLIPDLLVGCAQGLTGGLFLFYFQSVLDFQREAQTLLFIYFIGGLVGVPIWATLGRRIGKHRALQIGCLYWAASTAFILIVPPGNFAIAAPLMALAGIAQSAGVLLIRSMIADVVDEDELVTGARRSGLFFGIYLTTNKLGLAAGPLSYIFLQLGGFSPAAGANNDATALNVLGFMFIGLPILLLIAGAWLLRNYPLDEKRQAELAAAIAARTTPEN